MLTLLGIIGIVCIWLVATLLSLSVSDGTKATKETIAGFKDMKTEWDKTP